MTSSRVTATLLNVLFVELHQEGSAPAKNTYVVFYKTESQKTFYMKNRVIKKNFLFVDLFWQRLETSNFMIGNQFN